MKFKYKQKKAEDWHISKSYRHFDLPISIDAAKKYVLNPDIVAHHDFYPFISFEIETRRYKGKDHGATNKLRPIKYASHLDANIYSYYAMKLNEMNEVRLKSLGLDDCVIGYRSGKGSNIDLSKQAMDEIKARKNCVSIALDIKDFYGHIDHAKLEAEWCKILGKDKLPKDHLALFKSLTKWTSVDREKLIDRLGLDKNKLPLRLVSSPSELRAVRKEDKARAKIDKIFDTNPEVYGIPQGSPMSALLSNIYMIPFDQCMNGLAHEINGFYRRYSDDILFICDAQYKDMVLAGIDAALLERVELLEKGAGLKINHKKDNISSFSWDAARARLVCDTECQYLGFTFNGKNILIRSQTLSKFHRRIKFATRAAKRAARYATKHGGNPRVFRGKLNANLTPIGKQSFVGGYARFGIDTMGDKGIGRQIKGAYERVTKELHEPLKIRSKKKHTPSLSE